MWLVFAVALLVAVLATGSAFFGSSHRASGISRPPVANRTPTTIAVAANLPSAHLPFVESDFLDGSFELPRSATVSSTSGTEPTVPPPATKIVETTTTTNTTVVTAPVPEGGPTTTTVAPAPTTTVAQESGGALRLWDTAWQIAAKANLGAMQSYVDRIAAAQGNGEQSITGFWFSVVNINQDINTPNGYGHTFGSFAAPDPAYLDDVERLIDMASGRSLEVGIVVAWDGPNQYSVENGKLTVDNAYQYGKTIAGQWTRPDFDGRDSIAAWIMGGDTTDDCCGGEHGDVWFEVVRGIEDAQAANGFSGPKILLHTAPGQHLNYLGASWLDAHAPQTGHCADTSTAVAWMQELANTGAAIWGNGEMRYEEITWSCNGNAPITPEQVLADAIAMKNLGLMDNFVYGFDPRWNSATPGDVGLSASGVSDGLQLILDEPGLIRGR